MTTNDPISDMLTRIRNASAVNKVEVEVPFSNLKLAMAQIMKDEGYIVEVKHVPGVKVQPKTKKLNANLNQFDRILITLKYQNNTKSAIHSLKRISKPGRKVYCKKDALPIVLNGFGIAIISTPQGIMTNRRARKEGVGGEILCEIY